MGEKTVNTPNPYYLDSFSFKGRMMYRDILQIKFLTVKQKLNRIVFQWSEEGIWHENICYNINYWYEFNPKMKDSHCSSKLDFKKR